MEKSLLALDDAQRMLQVDEAEWLQLLGLFITTSDRDLARLREAFSSRQLDDVQMLAHRLKGSCRTLGLDDAFRALELLERMDEAAPDSAWSRAYADALAAMARCIAAARRRMGSACPESAD